nr:hypothetical protein [Chromobacterium sp. ASV5]
MKLPILTLAALLALPVAAAPLGKPAPLPRALTLLLQEDGEPQALPLCVDAKGRFALERALPQGELTVAGQLQPLPGRVQPLIQIDAGLKRRDGDRQSLRQQLLLDGSTLVLGSFQTLHYPPEGASGVVPQFGSILLSIAPADAGAACPQ